MDDLASVLSSITPDEMDRIKDIASSLFPSGSAECNASPKLPAGLVSILQSISAEDERIELIKALKPFLSEQRQLRADEAVRLLKLIRILPLIRELNINDLPV